MGWLYFPYFWFKFTSLTVNIQKMIYKFIYILQSAIYTWVIFIIEYYGFVSFVSFAVYDWGHERELLLVMLVCLFYTFLFSILFICLNVYKMEIYDVGLIWKCKSFLVLNTIGQTKQLRHIPVFSLLGPTGKLSLNKVLSLYLSFPMHFPGFLFCKPQL